MSDNQDFDWNKFSPATMFRDWVAKSEAQWSKTVSEMTKDPRASSMLNRQIDEARMMQRMFAEFAQGSLAMANLPSRSDIEGLDERLGRVEDGLATLSAEITRLREVLGPRAALAAPSRNRRPPATVAAQTVRPEPVEGPRSSKASAEPALSLSKSPTRTATKAKARPDPIRGDPIRGVKRVKR